MTSPEVIRTVEDMEYARAQLRLTSEAGDRLAFDVVQAAYLRPLTPPLRVSGVVEYAEDKPPSARPMPWWAFWRR